MAAGNGPSASTGSVASASSRSGTTWDATTSTASWSTRGARWARRWSRSSQYLSKDTTYGPLHRFLFGCAGVRDMSVVDEERGLISAYGKEIVILREARDPKDIPWRDNGVALVVECTGTFRDPYAEAGRGARVAPRPPGRRRGRRRPELAVQEQAARASRCRTTRRSSSTASTTTSSTRHGTRCVSAASCTTTALAHMMRPLLDRDLTRDMITAGMSTVHAVTNSQPVLDAVPERRRHRPAQEPRRPRQRRHHLHQRRRRAGAGHARDRPHRLHGRLGAHPHASVSLIILNVTFQSETLPDGTVSVEREAINAIYRDAAAGEARGLLKYSDEQNVSADMLGEDAAVVIEGVETHTRTGFMNLRVPCDARRQGPARDRARAAHARQGLRLVRQRDGQLHLPAGRAHDRASRAACDAARTASMSGAPGGAPRAGPATQTGRPPRPQGRPAGAGGGSAPTC